MSGPSSAGLYQANPQILRAIMYHLFLSYYWPCKGVFLGSLLLHLLNPTHMLF